MPHSQPDHNLARYREQQLKHATSKLAIVLTEIDNIVRDVRSKPDWLSAALDELTFIERSLALTLSRIKEAKALLHGDDGP